MKHYKIYFAAFAALSSILLSSCRHKDLYMEESLSSDLVVVFDWRNAPDANPSAMAMYLYESDGTSPMRYIFSNKIGGHIKAPFGLRHALCLNADNTWSHMRKEENIEGMEIYTSDAETLPAQHLPASRVPRAEDASQERMATTPGMLWTGRTNNINISPHQGTDTITFYPDEAICHYTVDIYDVDNLPGVKSSTIDATLSGMSEAFSVGADATIDTPVTMTFNLKANATEQSLHSEFLTFGECPTLSARHFLTVYMVLTDGSQWYKSFDVTDQVSEAPDPKHVHIILRGLPLPEPPGEGGTTLIPDVNEWQVVNVDLKM